jgi:hypothetical protein
MEWRRGESSSGERKECNNSQKDKAIHQKNDVKKE